MNPAGSVLLDTNIVVAHFRNDPGIAAHLQTASIIYLPWVAPRRTPIWRAPIPAEGGATGLDPRVPPNRCSSLARPGRQRAVRPGESELADARKLIPENDIWIAALARQYDLPLAARDAHFAVVQGLNTLAW